MKNIILFGIVICLALFTYYFQEVGDENERLVKEKENQILNIEKLGVLQGIALQSVSLEKKGSLFYLSDDELVSQSRLSEFMNILSGIKIKRRLSSEELVGIDDEDIFTDPNLRMDFKFSHGKASFILGKKLDFDRSFYVKVVTPKKTEVVIAIDTNPMEKVYQKQYAHRTDHYYKRFKSFFYLKSNFFKDHRIFRKWMDKKWSLYNISIDSNRNKKFTLLLRQGNTKPKRPFFMNLARGAIIKFEKELAHLEAKMIHDKSILAKLNPISKIEVEASQGKVVLTLYKTQRNSKEIYLVSSSIDSKAFEIDEEDKNLFFRPLQEFWSMKLFEKKPDQVVLKFPKKIGRVKFSKVGDKFKAISLESDAQAIHTSFKKLMDFLGKKASYWSAGAVLAEGFIYQFQIDWGQGAFFLMLRNGEILLYHKDSQQGLVYKFDTRQIPVGVVYKDYFL